MPVNKFTTKPFFIFLLLASMVANADKEFVLDQAFAEHFADDWIASWNAHDLNRILSHYTDDFEMASPYIARRNFSENGVLQGKEAVGKYWSTALGSDSKLKFSLEDVLVSMDSLTLYYRNQNGRSVAEVFHFNASGLVHQSYAHYSIQKPNTP